MLNNDSVQSQKFRVINVEEQDGLNYAITAKSYQDDKYPFIEDGTLLPTRTVSVTNELKTRHQL